MQLKKKIDWEKKKKKKKGRVITPLLVIMKHHIHNVSKYIQKSVHIKYNLTLDNPDQSSMNGCSSKVRVVPSVIRRLLDFSWVATWS